MESPPRARDQLLPARHTECPVPRAEALGEATVQNRGGKGKERLSPLYGSQHHTTYRNAVTHAGAGRLSLPNADSAPSQPRTCLTTAPGPELHPPVTWLPEGRGEEQAHLQVRCVLEAGPSHRAAGGGLGPSTLPASGAQSKNAENAGSRRGQFCSNSPRPLHTGAPPVPSSSPSSTAPF